MRLPRTVLALFAACVSIVSAALTVVSPAGGTVLPAGEAFTVAMQDSGTAPALSLFSTYTLELVQGGQALGEQWSVASFGSTYAATLLSVPITLPLAVFSSPNSFFFKITLVAIGGGTYVDWSNRFSISGGTATVSSLPAAVSAALANVGGSTAGPAAIDNMGTGGAAGGAPGAEEWSIPYPLQTGLTKWAPMQPIPGTKITATSYTPLFPTSAYTLATTWLPSPTIVTTVTQSPTFSVSSYENPAAAAGQPTQNAQQSSMDVAKYLRRWADE